MRLASADGQAAGPVTDRARRGGLDHRQNAHGRCDLQATCHLFRHSHAGVHSRRLALRSPGFARARALRWADMRERTIDSFDGTRIVYRVGGRGERWLVVANGYGGTFCAWDDILAQLDGACRFLLWDYRGLHRSAIPADRRRLRIEDHCQDLDQILQAEGIERMVVAAWSIGVQVALEHYRRSPHTVDGLVLANGAHGRILQRSTHSQLARRVLPSVLRGLRTAAPVLAPGLLPPLRVAAGVPATQSLLRRLGVFNGASASLAESTAAVLRVDHSVYSQMILLADDHDADDLLGRIDVPAMVIAGTRDAITPLSLSRATAERIAGCRLRVVDGATHYGLMEFPDAYAAGIREILTAAGARSWHARSGAVL
jgi:pimeloyl-ACP methyl ester carboxylesterase